MTVFLQYTYINNPIILRISYVYPTYMVRIWYVNEKGKVGFFVKLGERLLDNTRQLMSI